MSRTERSRTASLEQVGAVSIRRMVNDEIARMGAIFRAGTISEFEFICECGDLRCAQTVSMSLAAYAETTPGSISGHAA